MSKRMVLWNTVVHAILYAPGESIYLCGLERVSFLDWLESQGTDKIMWSIKDITCVKCVTRIERYNDIHVCPTT